MALATAWTLILSFVRSSFTPVLVILISWCVVFSVSPIVPLLLEMLCLFALTSRFNVHLKILFGPLKASFHRMDSIIDWTCLNSRPSSPPLRLSISFSVNLHARAIDLALFHQILTSNSSLTLHLVCDLVRDMSDLEDNA